MLVHYRDMASPSETSETSPIEPMEALLVDALPDGSGWSYEPKWDGFRCLAVKRGGKVQLFAKSGKVLHRYFPEVVAAVAALKAADFILDGELTIPFGDSLSFDALQMRLHPAESRIRKLSAEIPALLVRFDLLEQDGKMLTDRTLAERRATLERLFSANSSPSFRLSPVTHSR